MAKRTRKPERHRQHLYVRRDDGCWYQRPISAGDLAVLDELLGDHMETGPITIVLDTAPFDNEMRELLDLIDENALLRTHRAEQRGECRALERINEELAAEVASTKPPLH